MPAFHLNFFVSFFNYTDARPSLLPRTEDKKHPEISFSKYTWAAHVIYGHELHSACIIDCEKARPC